MVTKKTVRNTTRLSVEKETQKTVSETLLTCRHYDIQDILFVSMDFSIESVSIWTIFYEMLNSEILHRGLFEKTVIFFSGTPCRSGTMNIELTTPNILRKDTKHDYIC